MLLVALRGADRTFFRDVFAQLVISLTELHNVRQLVEHGTTLYDCVAQWVPAEDAPRGVQAQYAAPRACPAPMIAKPAVVPRLWAIRLGR